MMAAIGWIKIIICFHSGSNFVYWIVNILQKGIQFWIANWKKNGWITSDGKPKLRMLVFGSF